MDPRQRAVNRRWRTKIAVFLAAGAALVVAGLLLGLLPEPRGRVRRGDYADVLLVLVGAVVIAATLGGVVVRLVRGPQRPGKRAAD